MHRRESPTTSADAANDINTTFLEEMVFSVIESHGGAGCISDDVRAALSWAVLFVGDGTVQGAGGKGDDHLPRQQT